VERIPVGVALALVVVAAAWAQTGMREESADPSALCRRSPDRPECKLFIERQAGESSMPTPVPRTKRRWRSTPSPQPTPAPHPTQSPPPAQSLAPDPIPCTTADEAAARAATKAGATRQPPPICPCEKAQGTIKGYLRDPADRSEQARVIEVCDTGAEYRLDGVLVIPKDASHPAFAQAALDDFGAIASVSDPSGHVGFEFLIRLIQALGNGNLPEGDRAVHVRWGAARNRLRPGSLGPITRPGTNGYPATSEQWRAATARGLDVYASDGTPVGGTRKLFGGLLKGTGAGIGSSVFYQPEMVPDPKSCPSGSTSDIVLLHELEHAARMALGEVDNTPYPNLWLNRDPLAALYGVHEEKVIVALENEYRAALERQHPNRHPNLRPRASYLGDC
jgi:hypothetical protein